MPVAWDGVSPVPVVVAFHGGGGNKLSQRRTTCPGARENDPACFGAVASRRGLAVVRPDGTGTRPFTNIRTWNSGGGVNGLNCASGGACASNVDDVAFFDSLLAEVARATRIDETRIYLTGLSNGASMSHRLACERPERIAAIAPVGGANQFAAAGGACKGPVPVLHVHGTEDPCWTYRTSNSSCLSEDGTKIGVAESLEGWRVRNGCATPPTETPLADVSPSDGTHAVAVRWPTCQADVEHLRIEGGGHTWPNGDQYFATSRIGPVTRDFGSELLVDFLLAHAKK